jgi:hypothetical protein
MKVFSSDIICLGFVFSKPCEQESLKIQRKVYETKIF